MKYGKNYARLHMYAREQASILHRRLGVNSEGLITSGSTTLIGQHVRITPIVQASTHPAIYRAYIALEILLGDDWMPLNPFGEIDPVLHLETVCGAFHESAGRSGMRYRQRGRNSGTA